MKKVILALAVAFATVAGVQAQDAAKVKVNVELNAFQSIEIGSGAQNPGVGYGDEVTLVYNTTQDYKQGVSVEVPKQLKVSSVGTGYKIKAALSYSGNVGNFGKVEGSGDETIGASELLEIAIAKNGVNYGASQTAAASLTFDGFGTIGDGASSVLDQELDVKYIGKPLDATKLGKLFGTGNEASATAKYTIDVVYTIATN